MNMQPRRRRAQSSHLPREGRAEKATLEAQWESHGEQSEHHEALFVVQQTLAGLKAALRPMSLNSSTAHLQEISARISSSCMNANGPPTTPTAQSRNAPRCISMRPSAASWNANSAKAAGAKSAPSRLRRNDFCWEFLEAAGESGQNLVARTAAGRQQTDHAARCRAVHSASWRAPH